MLMLEGWTISSTMLVSLDSTLEHKTSELLMSSYWKTMCHDDQMSSRCSCLHDLTKQHQQNAA